MTTVKSVSPKQTFSVAKQRWKMLGEVIRRKSSISSQGNRAISVRRFTSFGLLQASELLHEESSQDDSSHTWFLYTSEVYTDFQVHIRIITGAVKLEDVVGFNNTGNVCLWPAEEVLTYHCLKYRQQFKDKSVCELGGGMTCISGFALAACSEAKEVLLTDGNEQSVKNVSAIVERNRHQFGSTRVNSTLLLWDKASHFVQLEGIFDYIICADCLFFDNFREDLLHTIYKLLKHGGEAIIFAPSRGVTFQLFVELARKSTLFSVNFLERYDEGIWDLHQKMLIKGKEIYDENIHYPLFLHLFKTS